MFFWLLLLKLFQQLRDISLYEGWFLWLTYKGIKFFNCHSSFSCVSSFIRYDVYVSY